MVKNLLIKTHTHTPDTHPLQQFQDTENKLVVSTEEREEERGKMGVWD